MKQLPSRRPGDFDDNGLLKAPLLFWVGLIVLARAWWLAGHPVSACRTGRRHSRYGDAVYLPVAGPVAPPVSG